MSAWARPGVKCECIRVYWHPSDAHRKWAPNIPTYKGVYTVRAVVEANDGDVGLLFEEVCNPVGKTGWETGFRIDGFRPLAAKTIEQDVQMIFSLLEPSEVPV